jgi:hypothetical protein
MKKTTADHIAAAEKLAEKYFKLLDREGEIDPDRIDAAYERMCKYCWLHELNHLDFA